MPKKGECKCGCGQKTLPGQSYKRGHNLRSHIRMSRKQIETLISEREQLRFENRLLKKRVEYFMLRAKTFKKMLPNNITFKYPKHYKTKR